MPDIDHGLRTYHKGRSHFVHAALNFGLLFTKPQQIGDRLDGFTQPHVIGQQSAKVVSGEVSKEVKSFDLIRTQCCLQGLRHWRLDLDLNFTCTVFNTLPRFGIKHFSSFRICQLKGVHTVGLPS